MASFHNSINVLPGFYGIPDAFMIEKHKKGFRLFRQVGMYEPPPDIIGSYRDLAKHIFLQILEVRAPHNEYYINPFIVNTKPVVIITLMKNITISKDIIAPEFLVFLSHELGKLINLIPFS